MDMLLFDDKQHMEIPENRDLPYI